METVQKIYEQMLACYEEKSGIAVETSCDLSVRLYAAAAQIEALYGQCGWVVKQCFPQTAQGQHLDYHAAMRGLERKQAVCAAGILRFIAAYPGETDRVIPGGTVAMTAGRIRFETAADVVLPAGATAVDVTAYAVEGGVSGNVAAGSIVSMAAIPTGINKCENPAPFVNGADAEDDESLRQRILDSYMRLPNGANVAYYEQEALSFDAVQAVNVIPRSRGIGTVDVVIATKSGIPGGELLELVGTHFQRSREIAVDVAVRAPQPVTVNLKIAVTPAVGVDFTAAEAAVAAKLDAWFCGERLGKDCLRIEVASLVFTCPEVANCSVLLPAEDISISEGQLPVLGSLTVEELS